MAQITSAAIGLVYKGEPPAVPPSRDRIASINGVNGPEIIWTGSETRAPTSQQNSSGPDRHNRCTRVDEHLAALVFDRGFATIWRRRCPRSYISACVSAILSPHLVGVVSAVVAAVGVVAGAHWEWPSCRGWTNLGPCLGTHARDVASPRA